ncbi:MAG: hypothetical protein BGO21_14125 [Dyadobacter sp. 50-39]|nr:MAG: hypothetical protein BGO21_14125 [Dyadobacter sp. 50-39]
MQSVFILETRRNQRDQNRRWDDLNNARAELGAVHATIFRTLKVSEEELAGIIVGYVPAIYSSNVSDGKNTEFHQLSLITAVDALTGENIQYFNPRCLKRTSPGQSFRSIMGQS